MLLKPPTLPRLCNRFVHFFHDEKKIENQSKRFAVPRKHEAMKYGDGYVG